MNITVSIGVLSEGSVSFVYDCLDENCPASAALLNRSLKETEL
jgi:hypothetical protein